jgi:uncharacterized membrane protein YoaK (UPF0700 family)
MGLSGFSLFVAAAGGELFSFGVFGDFNLRQDYILLALLCMASGLQNAAITSSSGRSIRTTHLTGLTTDLGLGLAKILTIDSKQSLFPIELRANYLRAGSIAAFIMGSALGAFIFLRLGYNGFVLPGLISLYAAWHGRQAKKAYLILPGN